MEKSKVLRENKLDGVITTRVAINIRRKVEIQAENKSVTVSDIVRNVLTKQFGQKK